MFEEKARWAPVFSFMNRTVKGGGACQHNASDIKNVIRPILESDVEVVIGVRSMKECAAPSGRIIGNRVLDTVTSGGEGLHDAQSGFSRLFEA